MDKIKSFCSPKKYLLLFSLFIATVYASAAFGDITFGSKLNKEKLATGIIQGLLDNRNPFSKIPSSQIGQKNNNNTYFVYDLAHNAMELHISGHQKEAEEFIDEFLSRRNFFVHSIPKSIPVLPRTIEDIMAEKRESSIGDIAWLGLAFLKINPIRYERHAKHIGHLILKQQQNDGAILDPQSRPERIDIQDHLEATAFLKALGNHTSNPEWNDSHKKAWTWLEQNALDKKGGKVVELFLDGKGKSSHSTKAFTTLISVASEYLELETILKLIETVERKSLIQVSFQRPDKKNVTVILPDVTNPNKPSTYQETKNKYRLKRSDDRYHPIGTTELAGRFMTMYQVAAVKAFREKRRAAASILKSKAISMLNFSALTFHKHQKGLFSPYSTLSQSGKLKRGVGSASSAWIIFPIRGYNPYTMNNKRFSKTYNKIKPLDIGFSIKELTYSVKNVPYIEKGSNKKGNVAGKY